MILLALDSVSDRPGVVISDAGGERFLSLEEESPRRRFAAPRLGPVDHLRTVIEAWGGDVSRLDAVAVIVGPGSYTGLRSGLAALGGLLFGRRIRVAGIETFDALLAATADAAIPVVRMRRDEWAVRAAGRAGSVDAAGLKELIAGRRVVALGELPEAHGAELLARTMSLAEAAAAIGLERAARGELSAFEEITPRYLGSYADRG